MAGRHRRPTEPSGNRGRWLTVAGAAVAVVVLAVVLPLIFFGNGSDGSPNAAGSQTRSSSPAPSPSVTIPTSGLPTTTSTTTTTTPPPTTTTPPPTTSSSTKTTPPPPPAPTLVVRADRGETWLTVTDGHGQQRYNALLRKGHEQRFDGPFYNVVIGNAGAVVVVVNGQQRPRGGTGQVLRFQVRRS